MTGQPDETPKEPDVGHLWRRKGGGETLRIARRWHNPRPDCDDDGWLVRGHPIRGGRPLVCPAAYLVAEYEFVGKVPQ